MHFSASWLILNAANDSLMIIFLPSPPPNLQQKRHPRHQLSLAHVALREKYGEMWRVRRHGRQRGYRNPSD